ncbi:hypothetical protein GWK48_01175 [Metallosphaera tengchongensis]|uniref:DUF3311 domain-containing protein n=1 Tax=Metallosphaera tengchongensis TaxID=1532350 RepID=A0A6N0NVM3_9CREN|nr:hypothetical protein [Metallosphaera tengchongensis]QKQ99190.1 hypothetical protein GWK48_01175 [Metallosphaera tengchongensis]
MGKFYLAMGVVLLIDIILYSIYPLFNNSSPSIGGLTNFYSYQIILLFVSTILFAGISLAIKENGSRKR